LSDYITGRWERKLFRSQRGEVSGWNFFGRYARIYQNKTETEISAVNDQFPTGGTRAAEESGSKTALPPIFRVLMHNDDFTSMEFVVEVLERVFHKSPTDANLIMLNIHFKGLGMCGVFPHEIAETKIDRVHGMARNEGFPLRCSMEPV
jgi:ATP-dependent Clp protease adaptor protein ClpS